MSDADRRDPAATAEAALLLLSRGRADMARRLLEPLPSLTRGAVGGAAAPAYEAGRDDGVRAARKAKPPRPEVPAGGKARPSFKRQAAELVGHVDRLGLTRTA